MRLSHDIAFEGVLDSNLYCGTSLFIVRNNQHLKMLSKTTSVRYTIRPRVIERLRSFSTHLTTSSPKFTLTRIANALKQYYLLTRLYTRNVSQTRTTNALKQYYLLIQLYTRNVFQTKARSLLLFKTLLLT